MTKNLNINRADIHKVVNDYFEGNCEIVPKILKETTHQYNIQSENLEKNILLTFYFNCNGTTSIQYAQGKNPTQGKELAYYIKEKCVKDSRENVSLNLAKNITIFDFNDFIEYLKLEMEDSIKIESEKKETNTIYRIKHLKFEDSIILNLFTNGTLQIQGKPLFLFNYITNYFIEIGTLLIKDYGTEIHKVELKKDILKELESELPKSYSYFGKNLKNIMSSTLFVKNIDTDLHDYSFITFPILRGIEGVLKELTIRYGILKSGDKTFHMFDKDSNSGIYSLNPKYNANVPSSAKIDSLNDLYNFYSKHRHTLFHVEQIDLGTRLLSKADAINITNDAILYIENNY